MKSFITIIVIVFVIVLGVVTYSGNKSEENNREESSSVSPHINESVQISPQITPTASSILKVKNSPPIETKEKAIKEFNVTGKNFEFSIDEIQVNVGDTVRINFQATQGTHDWVLDEFGARTNIISGEAKSSVEFVVSRAGEFEFYCSVGTHRSLGMIGKLIVK